MSKTKKQKNLILDLFFKMASSKQPATNRGAILKYGTFAERTRHLINLKDRTFSSSFRLNFSIAYTLAAYANNLGIKLNPLEIEPYIESVVQEWSALHIEN